MPSHSSLGLRRLSSRAFHTLVSEILLHHDETLAAVGLAGNIINFPDSAVTVVSKGREIHHSHIGQLDENSDLEIVTRDLLLLQTQMEKSLESAFLTTNIGQPDNDLVKLLQSSNSLAREPLERLNKAKSLGRPRRWKSLRQAVKSVCSKREVDGMARRLMTYREQFQIRVLSSLR